MPKRGQAAMEFLMTYGWAILAVLITIAALAYFGVLSPSLFLPESIILMPGLAVKDFTILENAVIINVQNGMGKNLKNVYLAIPKCISGDVGSSGRGNLNDGETRKFIIGCNTDFGAGKKVNEEIDIIFTEESLSHTRKGKLSGRSGKGRLLVYYSFDNAVATDLSGNGRNGVIAGANCNVNGKYGNGCLCNAGYVFFDATSGGLPSSTISVEAQINVNVHKNWNNLIWFRWVNNGWLLYSDASGVPIFGIGQSNLQYNSANPSKPLSLTSFHHMIGVYNGNNVRIIVDGVPSNPTAITGATLDISAPSVDICSGSANIIIDEVAIYDTPIM